MSRFMNSRGFPCLFPPLFDPPLANHARHPTRNAPVATMATTTNGFGGIWPFPTPRIARPRGMPVAHPFAAAAAAGPTFVPCASTVGEGREWREKGARDGTDDFARRRAEEGRSPSARVGGRSDAPSRLPRTCPRPVRRRTTRRGTAEPWRTRLRRTHPRRGFLDRWRRRRGWRRRPRRRVSRRASPDPRRGPPWRRPGRRPRGAVRRG